MSSTDFSGALWRKSSYSNGQANCVEVATITRRPVLVAIRDSKTPDSPPLTFNAQAWLRFTNSLGSGAEDRLDFTWLAARRRCDGRITPGMDRQWR